MPGRSVPRISPIILSALALAGAFGQTPSGPSQGDTFNSNTNTSPCAQAYTQALKRVSADNARVEAQWRGDQTACNGNSSCLDQAQQRMIAGARETYKARIDANAQNDICQLRSGRGNIASGPCERTYAQAMEKVAEHNVQIRAQWYRDQADCNGKGSCVQQAQQRRLAAEQAVREEVTNAAIQRGLCQKQPGLPGQVSGIDRQPPADSGASPRPPLLKGRISKTGPSNGAANPGNGTSPRQTPPGSQTPAADPNLPVDYFRGFAAGMGDCFTGFVDLFAATGMMAKGDFVSAARLLGVEPGKSLVLKSIWQELVQTKVVGKGVSYYDQGRAAGRRICTYALIPGALKVRKALATVGETRWNPIRGPDLGEAMAGAEKGLDAYKGKWVATGKGPVQRPVQLGKFVGRGSFSTVYEMAGDPDKVIKIGNNPAESPGSFARQKEGAQRLKSAGVETPNIDYVDPGTAVRPGSLITGNVFKRGPPGSIKIFSDPRAIMGTSISRALQDVYDNLAQKGYIWGDGHLGNIAFEPTGPGTWRGVVIDPDMILTPAELADAIKKSTLPGNVVSDVLYGGGVMQNALRLFAGEPVAASALSDDLFAARGFIRQSGPKP